ncbi:hypothetical protein FHW37_1226 [Neorhizobium alkalisoli]|uniref:Uncharacterized protein n=1 Tax=Neorhizobium alkalisoli TaxID=528178 RepID=A0A561PYX9_9HYPH|nr:hypothetical protein FHW37_1226 [Neorhizobium alkalisoli]
MRNGKMEQILLKLNTSMLTSLAIDVGGSVSRTGLHFHRVERTRTYDHATLNEIQSFNL